MGPGTVNACPHSHYPTGDGRWVAIACTNDKIFARLAELMGRPELAGEGRFGTYARRHAARAEVDRMVGDWSSGFARDELLRMCDEAQVPCGMVCAIDEIFGDPQYEARGNILRFDDPRIGEVAVPNVVPRLTGTPGGVRWLGRETGADSDDILATLLGKSAPEIGALREKGVV